MAEHRRVADILGAIADREQIHGLVEPRVPPALKYKKEKDSGLHRPDIRVGCKLVLPYEDREGEFWARSTAVTGYALAVVLDYSGARYGSAYFYGTVTAIVQITRVTNKKLLPLVGRLRHIDIGSSWHAHREQFCPEEVQLGDYKWIAEEA